MTEDKDQGVEQSFVVRDKRRFDSDGNEKSGDSDSGDEVVASDLSEPEVGEGDNSEGGELEEGEGPEITFSSFVMSLATQALMQLGDMKAPPGLEIPVDKIAAKQTIDILSMLREKSLGNLDDDEKRLIEEVLHNLRMSYVRA